MRERRDGMDLQQYATNKLQIAVAGGIEINKQLQNTEQVSYKFRKWMEMMIVAMQDEATEQHIQDVIERMVELGFNVHRTTGTQQTILAGVGTPAHFDVVEFKVLPGVHDAYRISSPYKLAGRSFRPEGTTITFANGVVVGGEEVVVMAGPCSVESREQILLSAKLAAAAGAKFLRGGAYKPRSSPYSFQGMGRGGAEAAARGGRRRPACW